MIYCIIKGISTILLVTPHFWVWVNCIAVCNPTNLPLSFNSEDVYCFGERFWYTFSILKLSTATAAGSQNQCGGSVTPPDIDSLSIFDAWRVVLIVYIISISILICMEINAWCVDGFDGVDGRRTECITLKIDCRGCTSLPFHFVHSRPSPLHFLLSHWCLV